MGIIDTENQTDRKENDTQSGDCRTPANSTEHYKNISAFEESVSLLGEEQIHPPSLELGSDEVFHNSFSRDNQLFTVCDTIYHFAFLI